MAHDPSRAHAAPGDLDFDFDEDLFDYDALFDDALPDSDVLDDELLDDRLPTDDCCLAMDELEATQDVLDGLVDLLADTCRPDRGEPVWVKVLGSPADPHLVVSPGHVIPLGWVAPPTCWATGLVAGGRSIRLDRPDRLPEPGVRVICLQARCGPLAARVDMPDGSLLDQAPTSGRIVDLLRRCFALPTEPPPVPASDYLSRVWLTAIIRQASLDASPSTWLQVCALHPCADMISASRLGRTLATTRTPTGIPANVAREDAIVAASEMVTWATLHHLARSVSQRAVPVRPAATVGPADPLRDAPDPDLAHWMDAGMFARWLLEQTPPLELLRDSLAQSVDRTLASRVYRVLDRLSCSAGDDRAGSDGFGGVRLLPNG